MKLALCSTPNSFALSSRGRRPRCIEGCFDTALRLRLSTYSARTVLFKSQPFDDRDVGLTAAFAHRLQAVFAALGIKHAEQCRHQFGARCAERMA